MPSRDPEPRRKKRDHDRDSQDAVPRSPRDKDMDKDRLRPTRSSKSKLASTDSLRRNKDRDTDHSPGRAASSSGSSIAIRPKKVTMIVPEMQRRRSDDRAGGASVYPSFSKAHSREAVNSRESIAKSPYTPDATDLGQPRSDKRSASAQAPPSPPLTQVQRDLRRAASGNSIRRTAADTTQDYMVNARKGADGASPRGLRTGSSLRHAEEGRSATSAKPAASTPLHKSASTSARSSPSKAAKASTSHGSLRGREVSAATESFATDSDATSVGPSRTTNRKPPKLESNRPSSPPSDNGSSPHTPKDHDGPYSPFRDLKSANPIEVFHSTGSKSDFEGQSEITAAGAPPPPPPAPAMNTAEIPRVDYLLHNGGLANPVPRAFATAARPPPTQPYQAYSSPATRFTKASDAQETFAPYAKLLENFNTVIAKNGSVAVATGYKSVARRLLDRLETVFARNISCEACPCAMCRSWASNGQYTRSDEDNGVSWGEVLELVSGRQELPQWPPFTLPTSETGLGISHLEAEAPMQKLDIDVPEEYREHYIRQSKKTKQSVQKWLASQPEEQASPPQEVDDETLMFAMLTYLEPDQRRIFTALMKGLSAIPESRAPTPAATEPKSDFMTRIGTALQRLYRLSKTPREPECAMYLLNNPPLHAALATLSAINASEWEVLISGRFDGFLWSGAEDGGPIDTRGPPKGPSRGPNATPLSRNGTPFSAIGGVPLSRGPTPHRGNGTPFMQGPSRGPTPANTAPGPVTFDEETEIAVLAEVEREIYLGMEALEDAFEALHVKAESVRRALRERSTGLALQAQSRRGQSDVEVRMGTPAPVSGWEPGNFGETVEGESEIDDGLDDVRSELAPDDSASNVGWREHGRRKERRKRREKDSGRMRTPAVAEEDEEESDTGRRRRRH